MYTNLQDNKTRFTKKNVSLWCLIVHSLLTASVPFPTLGVKSFVALRTLHPGPSPHATRTIRANYAILFFFSLNANMCFEIDNTRVLYVIINDQQQNKQVQAGADPGFGVGGGGNSAR